MWVKHDVKHHVKKSSSAVTNHEMSLIIRSTDNNHSYKSSETMMLSTETRSTQTQEQQQVQVRVRRHTGYAIAKKWREEAQKRSKWRVKFEPQQGRKVHQEGESWLWKPLKDLIQSLEEVQAQFRRNRQEEQWNISEQAGKIETAVHPAYDIFMEWRTTKMKAENERLGELGRQLLCKIRELAMTETMLHEDRKKLSRFERDHREHQLWTSMLP